MLLDHGADIDVRSGSHGTLILAARNLEMIDYLVKRGAAMGGYGKHGTVLQNAISGDHVWDVQLGEVVHSLLRYGAEVNEYCPELGTALYTACLKGQDSIVKILLDHGADIEFRGGDFETALIAAAAGLSELQVFFDRY